MNLHPFSQAEWDEMRAAVSKSGPEVAQALIDAGVIDNNGKVLIRMPSFKDDARPKAKSKRKRTSETLVPDPTGDQTVDKVSDGK